MTDRTYELLAIIVIIVCLVGAIIVLSYQYSLEHQKVEDLKISLILTEMQLINERESNLLHQIEGIFAAQRVMTVYYVEVKP